MAEKAGDGEVKDNRRTRLIKRLMQIENVSAKEFAERLGTNPDGLYLKNAHNRFTIDDLMKLLEMRKLRLLIEDENHTILGTIQPDFFVDEDEVTENERKG